MNLIKTGCKIKNQHLALGKNHSMQSSPKRQKEKHEEDGEVTMNHSVLVATEEAPHNEVGFVYVKQILHFCEICDKVFKNAGILSIHVKHKHNGIPPPTCSVCSKVFKTKTELGNHVMNKHTDRASNIYIEWKAAIDSRMKKTFAKEGPSVCMTCNKEFKTKSILKTHIITQHTDKDSVEYKEFIGKRSGKRGAKSVNEDDANKYEFQYSDSDDAEEEEEV